MKNNSNWIKLSRQIFEWEWYTDIKVFKLFIHLILECNYLDKQWRGIDVSRGQLITGRKKLSIKTGLSEQEVRTVIEKLISTNELTKETIKGFTRYTVVNYDKWQSNFDEFNQVSTNDSTSILTSNQPQLKKGKNKTIYINTTSTIETLSNNLILIDRLSRDFNVTSDTIKEMIDKFCNWLVDTEKEIHTNNHDLFKHFESWLKKQNISEYELETEVGWFIKAFNSISGRDYKLTPTIKKLFAKQFENGYTGEQMTIAIQNLFSYHEGNKFHKSTSFKNATPNYLLKDDNMNKYLNVLWSKEKNYLRHQMKRIG